MVAPLRARVARGKEGQPVVRVRVRVRVRARVRAKLRAKLRVRVSAGRKASLVRVRVIGLG